MNLDGPRILELLREWTAWARFLSLHAACDHRVGCKLLPQRKRWRA